ncbi:CmcI family methyltransferase [Chlorogloeopsis sp. ULAP01]|uniref:CmcI family methyltransferase n=1 Tax=Chlorogloeopsis sp. ULAP01 TaxID=3056483 RepID=UPI0025AA4A1F|nr:CmcI family methyltransferase [Chlorogloeopsis sp. ULAP01]MDM9381592.1 CmcI family methyltransferase [Chlorogloeopsis sp. ULAP01]
MPVDYDNETFYSSEELSQILRVTPEDVIAFVKDKNFNTVKLQNVIHIPKNTLEDFFDKYFSFQGITGDRNYYRIPDWLKNSTSPWAITLTKMYQKTFNYPSPLSPEQGEFLKSLVCNIKPKNVLEIGCFTGISTIWMAAGLEQIGNPATIHSVDLFDDIMPWLPHRYGYLSNPLEFAQESVATAQLSHRIKFHKMNSQEMGKKYHEIINEPIDFLFIDGDHTKRGCLTDLILFYPHVSIGGYILLHDIYPEDCDWDGPRFVIDKFLQNNSHFDLVEVNTSPNNFGIALIRKLSIDRKLDFAARLLKTPSWQRIKNNPIGKIMKKLILN